MKTFLMLVGGGALAIIAIVAVAFGYFAYLGNQLDASSKAYVDASVPAIVSNWSKDELLKRGSPQFHQAVSEEQANQLFEKLRGLGALQNYEGASGQANMSYTPQNGASTTASYKANATFQNGKAEIQVKLIQVDGSWEILGFYVNAPLLTHRRPHPDEQ